MWSRAELKIKAKNNLSKNYWKVIVVTLILGLTTGVTFRTISDYILGQKEITGWLQGIKDSADRLVNENFLQDAVNDEWLVDTARNFWNTIPWDTVFTLMIVAVLVSISGILFTVFLLNPLRVGCMKWYLKNRQSDPKLGILTESFRENYGNIVKIMFLMGLYVCLWTLLLIIPGIVKLYEYRMIPYIVAENPGISARDAFARTKEMTQGDKWNIFILDVSFIGWHILGGWLCGLVSFFFVRPYVELTNVELYVKLKELKLGISDVHTEGTSSDPYYGTGNGDHFNDGYTEI